MSEQPSLEVLEAERNAGYGLQPVPASRDRDIETLLRAEMSAGGLGRLRMLIDDRHESTLQAFAERMATLAVRERSEIRVELGLVALSLAGLGRGAREAIMVLALLFDAARRVGASPDRVLVEAAVTLGNDTCTAVHAFLTRSETDKSLASMGFRFGSDADGPRYLYEL